ncbi:MAG: hypothetical protein J6L96_09010, partial [Clostridia bacterium]|nr:hypothetical protein [Clostridia bacterium]
MKKTFKKIVRTVSCIVFTAAILLEVASVSYPKVTAAYSKDSNIQSMESEIAALQAQQSELLGKINAIKGQESEAAQYKQYMDSLVTATTQKIDLAEKLIEELDTKIEETEDKIAECETAISTTRAKFIERLRYSQDNGNISELELLLDAKGLPDFLTRFDKVNSMMEYDKNVLESYKAQMTELEEYMTSLEESKKIQADAISQLETDNKLYETQAAEKDAYMESLKANKEKYEKEYQNALAAENALNAELEDYINKVQSQNQVVPSGDGFIRPLPVGVGYISSHFGNRYLNGRYDNHGATDIACAHGTTIFASNSGKVIRAEWHPS